MSTALTRLGLGRRTLLMGILNVTPDSFSDGGLYAAIDDAVRRGMEIAEEGADIVDIGGESTRPSTFRDNSPLGSREEKDRILPVIKELTRRIPGICISVDTYKADVAEAALDVGASILNDISGLAYDENMAPLAARSGAPTIVMHMPGLPRRIEKNPQYDDIIEHLKAFFDERAAYAQGKGVALEQIVVDPGIGFGKNFKQSMEIIRRMQELRAAGYPVLSGPSRKSFLGSLLGDAPPQDRLEGSAAAIALSIAGGAEIVRVHDVRFMARLSKVCDGILRSATEEAKTKPQ